jgi:putative acetyltransferase
MRSPLTFRLDDLSGEPTRTLIARHLAAMRANSPPCSVHALDVDGLRAPDVTFWSVWVGEKIAGCGALKRLDATRGELKSMRVADAFLGRGVGRGLLEHLIREARGRDMESPWLETGSSAHLSSRCSSRAAGGRAGSSPGGRRGGSAHLTTQVTVASTTTPPERFKIAPVTCGGAPSMNDASIAVAPAAMSPASLSKSNSTSSPTVARAPAVALLAPDVARAW